MSITRIQFLVFIFFGTTQSLPLLRSTSLGGLPLTKPVTIMLNPAGDAQNTGRVIDGTYERGITLQCCESIKKSIENNYKNVRVLLTRTPGETIEPLQNASFANRLGVDLYISIHFFEKKQGIPTIDCYYFCLNKVTDRWHTPSTSLTFVPYEKAYLDRLPITKKIAATCTQSLKDQCKESYTVRGPWGIPLVPLRGIKGPAIMFEASLASSKKWQTLVPALIQSIELILETILSRI